MRRQAAAALALIGLSFGTAFANCDATPPVPASIRSADSVAEYRSTLRFCRRQEEDGIAIRSMSLGGETALLIANPRTLETRLERATCWQCADIAESELFGTRMMRTISNSAELPGLARRGFLANAGITHGERGGEYLTGDLCPSSKPLDREFLVSLEGKSEPTPIALAISGLWLKNHFLDYRWLIDQERERALRITWVNHTYSHPFKKGLAEGHNFLLSSGVDPDFEILETERLLIANGATPSLFFRFPGLISSSPLMQTVRRHHLISLGADAWLALNQAPRDGSIILVHPNGNEELGLKIYSRDVVANRPAAPLKPLEKAPE